MLTALAVYLHDINPYFIKLWEGGPIRWYALSYLAGFSIGYLLVRRVFSVGRSPLSPQQAMDLVVVLAIGIMIGGRLGYVLFYRPDLLVTFHAAPPFWDVLALHRGGMASHGGILGGIAGCFFFAWRHKVEVRFILDLMAFGAPLGLFFGRIANFINGELYGRPASETFPLAVKFPSELYSLPTDRMTELATRAQDTRFPGLIDRDTLIASVIRSIQEGNEALGQAIAPMLTARHPSQLYAALGEGLLVFIVLLAVWTQPRKPGVIAGLFCICYGLMRIANEAFREPDAHLGLQALGLSRGQWLSVPLVLLGLALVYFSQRAATQPMGGWLAEKTPPAQNTPS